MRMGLRDLLRTTRGLASHVRFGVFQHLNPEEHLLRSHLLQYHSKDLSKYFQK